ncbi:MAG: hypothetical protein ACE5Q6_00690 [Dehalococcoidia bacterium]
MKQLLPALALNILGLAVTGWGVAMLVGIYAPIRSLSDGTIAAAGLAVLGLSTLWLLLLLAISWKGRPKPEEIGLPAEDPPAIPLPNSNQLFMAIRGLTEDATELIEKRREIHYLNMQQWHREHREETAAEIEATKRYRDSKNTLDLERLAAPTQFWTAVDNLCALVDRSLNDEVYSAPGDRVVHDAISRYSQYTIQQLQDISSGARN